MIMFIYSDQQSVTVYKINAAEFDKALAANRMTLLL